MTHEEAIAKLRTDMQLRGMAKGGEKQYVLQSKKLMKHFDKPVEELEEPDLRAYLEYLNNQGTLSPATLNTYNSALRFFFEVTLEKNLNYKRIPRKKDPIKVPAAFSRQEILCFMAAVNDDLRYKAIFSLTYGSGLRLSEVQKLRVKDIDSEQMRLFVYQGKGQRDRWVPMAQVSLVALREYFKVYRPKHLDGYLFLNGKDGKAGNSHISDRAIQDAFKKYHKCSKIKTYGTTHTLRHSYATHLMEDGVNVFYIQKILGHATLWTTMRYLRIAMTDVMKTQSPLDKLMENETERKAKSQPVSKDA